MARALRHALDSGKVATGSFEPHTYTHTLTHLYTRTLNAPRAGRERGTNKETADREGPPVAKTLLRGKKCGTRQSSRVASGGGVYWSST